MNNKILKFELSPQNIKIKNLLLQDFVCVEIFAVSDIKVNRNKSHFTLESLKDAIPTVYNKPVLGAFENRQNDFKGHDTAGLTIDPEYDNLYFDYSDGKSEVPLGVIREQDTIDIIKRNGLNWLHFTCVLWAKYNYKGVKRLLKDGKKSVSVEIEVLESHIDDQGIEIIDKFSFDGVTILGQNVTPAIPDASISILEKLDDAVYQKQEKCLSFAYKALDDALNTASVTDIVSTTNTQEVDTQLKESFDTNVDNDEQSPVGNEGTEEITMNDEQKGGENLTYEEKRQLLELALNRSHNDNGENDCPCCCYVWVADIDDTNVYYQSGDEGYYSAPYHFEETEEGMQAVIDFENKVAVVRSWKQYAEENPEEEKEDNKEVEACNEEEKKEEEACHETEEESDEGEKKSVMEENSENESCEGKECEAEGDSDDDKSDEDKSDDEKSEDEPSEEKKEEESCEDKQEEACDKSEFAAEEEPAKEEFAEENLKDDGKPEGEVATVSTSETEMEQHDDSNINENDGNDTLLQEAAQEMGIVFTVGEKQFTAEEFQAEYERVNNALAEMTEKYNAVNAEVMAKKSEEFYNFACEIVDAETDLTAESAEHIKGSLKFLCNDILTKGNTSFEDAHIKEFTEDEIARALYAQKKMSKKTNSEEFSASIVKNNASDSETVNVGVNANLKSAIEKLRKI